MFKKKNKDSISASSLVAACIPYIRTFEEEGVIETTTGVFTKSYLIEEAKDFGKDSLDKDMLQTRLEQLYNGFPLDVIYQFTIHNRLVELENYLKKVLITPNKEDAINQYIELYNNVIVDNVNIGHNNVSKTRYLTISTKKDVVDEAIDLFRTIDADIKRLFINVAGIRIKALSLPARLKTLYTMLNPYRNEFGKKADLDGNGEFKVENLKYLKLTTKDVIAPDEIEYIGEQYRDHIVINKDTYIRSFFICNVPANVNSSMVADLTNVSSNMIFSELCECIDSEIGFNYATKRVAQNTVVKTEYIRNTIADRKNKRIKKTETFKENNEQTYFERAALEQFKRNVASGYKTIVTTFVIVLVADSLENLERDSDLLRISAAKFGCQVKSLDGYQLEGLQSALPLAQARLDVRRIVDIPRLAILNPLGINEALKKDGLYCGLNEFNDNLILLNRKNDINSNGLIVGTAGKTYQAKRESFNALASTNDKVVIITTSDDYDEFAEKLGGRIITDGEFNPFRAVEGYGIVESKLILKSYYFKALTAMVNRNHYSKTDISSIINSVEKELELLYAHLEETSTSNEDLQHITECIQSNRDAYPVINDTLSKLKSCYFNYDEVEETENIESRLIIYKAACREDLLLLLDNAWNEAIEDKKRNISSWIFVDSMDEMLKNLESCDYIQELMGKCNQLETIFTMVVENSMECFANSETDIAFEELIQACGYFKLLNLGPLERRKYAELLNIQPSLLKYVSNVEPGKGLILTSASDFAFDDSLTSDSGEFEELFARKIVQLMEQ